MIQVVVDNLNIDATYIYVVQKEHREKYNLDTLLNLITPNCKIVEVDGLTAESNSKVGMVVKDFQWNMPLQESFFDPNIPDDYTSIEINKDTD